MLPVFKRIFTSSALCLIFASTSVAQSGSLPELGESSSRYLNARQEAEIGKQFLRQLMRESNFVTDPELKHYLNSIGRQIGRIANLQGTKLNFNLLEENELNAFAVPGGYITFNTGLLLTTETESELASVVGHEIAHLSQRHLPRMIAKAEASKLPTTAAIIASLLIGGQAGIAGVTVANANMLSNQLSYSRGFEREADAIGMGLMANSGYDPKDMPNFFNKLQRFNTVSNKDVPEFLRSHPLSYTRIAESEARLNSYTPNEHTSSKEFYFARAKIRASYSGRFSEAEQILRDGIENLTDVARDASQYGLGIALMEQRKYKQASKAFSALIDRYPDFPALNIAMAENDRKSSDPASAASRLETLIAQHPDQTYINYYYIDALLDNDDASAAKKVARYQLRRNPSEIDLLKKLSAANVALGDLAEAHQADGEYLAALGDFDRAIQSMKLALRDNADQSQYLKQSVTARITALEQSAADAKLIKN